MKADAPRRSGAVRRPSAVGAAKPIDLGNGFVVASMGSDGAWLSLGAADRRHGYVELSALPRFRARWREDPGAVRRYRRWMAEDRFAFLRLEVPGEGGVEPVLELGDGSVPSWSLAQRRCLHRVIAWADPAASRIFQRHTLLGRAPGGPGRCELRFRGRLAVHPAPEITEVRAVRGTRSRTAVRACGRRLEIAAEGLGAVAEIRVSARGGALGNWRGEGSGARLSIEPTGADAGIVEVMVECALGELGGGSRLARASSAERPGTRAGELPARAPATPPRARLGSLRDRVPATPPRARFAELRARARTPIELAARSAPPVPGALRGPAMRLARRAWSYIAGCTALRLADGDDEICLVTDHRALPLSWTRDAYYQALLLLTLDTPAGTGRGIVASHLRWLWGRCERPRGLWMRSHWPDGRARDLRYQADQQLFPLLELADYHRVTGELPTPPRAAGHPAGRASWWSERVGGLVTALPVAASGLLPTEENPADDAASLPFALSAQILCWYVARRLADLELKLEVDLATIGDRAGRAVGERFLVDGPFGPQWAYEIDGGGRSRLYQDANDLPTAFAPLLGFCSTSDPLWRATMSFALSEHNPGFSPGAWGGLGSLHTPGTWTLGDIQEWVAAGLLGDRGRSARALGRLLAVASPDGMLPEAYDSATGSAPVRLWFAWPGAALGALVAATSAGADRSGPRGDRQAGDRGDQLRTS